MESKQGQPYLYNDLFFRIASAILGAYLATEFGSTDRIFERLLSKWFYIEFGSSLVIAIVVVEIIAFFTRWLDKRFDWILYTVQRIGLQVVLCVILPGVANFFLATLYFRFFDMSILKDTNYLVYAFPYILLMIVVFNVYYLSHYLFLRFKQTKVPATDDDALQSIILQSGNKHVKVTIDEIACFEHKGDLNFLHTISGTRFIVPDTLESLYEKLPEQHFFRANRQVIVHHQVCSHYKKAKFGKLELYLSYDASISTPIMISQRRAKAFKEWFNIG